MTNTSRITNPAAPGSAPSVPADGAIRFRDLPSSNHPALRNVPPGRQVTSLTGLASQIAGTPRG